MGFDFNSHGDEKMRVLRKFVKKPKNSKQV